MAGRDLRLVLPLAALFAVFFVAPLCVLVALSLSTGAGLHGWTLAHYIKFFTDPFNYSILWSTILLGVKATLLCLVFAASATPRDLIAGAAALLVGLGVYALRRRPEA